MVSLTDVQTDLAYLLGEQSIPSTGSTDYTVRGVFIQRGLERIARFVDFDFSFAMATVSLVAGAGSLPTGTRANPQLDVRVTNSSQRDDYIFSPTTYEQFDSYSQGDYKYYLSANANTGIQSVVTTETTVPAVTVRYSLAAPTLNASISTNFPSSLVVAKAALIYQRESEDKDADTAPEIAKFQQELEEVIAVMDRTQPEKYATYIGDKVGKQTGEVFNSATDYKFSNIKAP